VRKRTLKYHVAHERIIVSTILNLLRAFRE